MHKIGEDRIARLDIVPAQLRVLVTVRPKFACRACTDGVTQRHDLQKLSASDQRFVVNLDGVAKPGCQPCKFGHRIPLQQAAALLRQCFGQ
ncbi:zinc-finger binding domain of transposase IS66 [Paracoccus seriniphilus]|uniref:Zinc-finger binding domain of transposase IS66 n=1 Tax=Paracoccus seriniphilus TaxID=184748 RepID=A0A239Q2N5_9RHOB|nr:zinc-finger binding domain of transposase IS66 [Paracoccus seriniphilus]